MLADTQTGRLWMTREEAEHVQEVLEARGLYVGIEDIRSDQLRALETAAPASERTRAMREEIEETEGVISPEPWHIPAPETTL